jgi:hypothetical protein
VLYAALRPVSNCSFVVCILHLGTTFLRWQQFQRFFQQWFVRRRLAQQFFGRVQLLRQFRRWQPQFGRWVKLFGWRQQPQLYK